MRVRVRVSRSAPLTIRLARLVAGEAAPKVRVRAIQRAFSARDSRFPLSSGSARRFIQSKLIDLRDARPMLRPDLYLATIYPLQKQTRVDQEQCVRLLGFRYQRRYRDGMKQTRQSTRALTEVSWIKVAATNWARSTGKEIRDEV